MDLLTTPLMKPTLSLLLAQSRILNALACGATLQGTPDQLIQRLDVGPEAFRAALHDLVEGGWVFTTSTPDGRLIVGRERRESNDGLPVRHDRRSSASLWEGNGASFAV